MHTYYSPREAAEFLGLSPLTLANWRSRGLGPVFAKLGEDQTDRIIYRRRDLEIWRNGREARARANARKPRPTAGAAAVAEKPKRKGGTPSYATRLARGERFEDLPAFSGKKRGA